MNKRHWISVHFNQDVPDNTIKELVRQSYDIVYRSHCRPEQRRSVAGRSQQKFVVYDIQPAVELQTDLFEAGNLFEPKSFM